MIRLDSLPPLLVVAMSAVLAVMTFRRGTGSATSRLYGWVNFFIGLFALGAFFRINAQDWAAPWTWVAGIISQTGDALVPIWILFAAAYAGQTIWLRGVRRLVLWIPFAINMALTLTEPLHGKFLGDPSKWPESMGPWFTWYFAVTALFILFGQTFFLRLAREIREPRLRRQVWVMTLASFVPFVTGAFYYLGPDVLFGIRWKIADFTTLSFLITDIAFFYVLFRLDFLDHLPMALLEVFDSLADPVILVSPRLRILRMNPAARKWFPDMAVGTALPDHFPQWTLHLAEKIHASETPPVNLSWRGRVFRPQIVATRRAAESHVAAVLLTDITDLEKAREEAWAASQAQTRFLMKVSHQMRNPLQGIIGFNEILSASLTGESQALAARSLEQSRRLLSQINNLIDFSRSLKDPEPPDIQTVSLPALCEDMLGSISDRLRDREIRPSFHLDPVLPPSILADGRRLRQVLLHLLDNAVQFTQTGFITLEANQISAEGEKVTLRWTVADSGRGMTALERDQAFDSYTRFELHADASRGHGLGLPLCRELLRQMGSTIALDSRPGEGTRVSFDLTATREASPASPVLPEDPGRPLRILVAEDQPVNRELLEILLTGWGCTVDSAENGRRAFEIFTGKPFDLVLLDVQMPEMNGFEVARAIRALPDARSRVPLLALTGHAYADRGEGDARLMDDWLLKPVPSLDLQAAIWKWTGRSQTPGGIGT